MSRHPLVLLAALSACTPAGPAIVEAPNFCQGEVTHRYDPLASDEMLAWPDDVLTQVDPGSPTGLRLDLNPTLAPWAPGIPDLLQGLIEGADRVSGFGRNAAMVLRFTGDVGTFAQDPAASLTDDGLRLLDLSVDPPQRVPYRAELGDDGKHLIVHPLRPLSAGAQHALLLTTEHKSAEGTCVAPSKVQRKLLTGGDVADELRPMVPRYADLLDRVGVLPDDLSAVLLFTTHNEQRVMADLVDHVRGETYDWSTPPTCDDDTPRRCEGAFEVWDYRHDRGISGEPPTSRWTLPVSVWLPEGVGPHPTVVFGHGMNGNRGGGRTAASRLHDLGIAVISIDLMEHGDHPTSDHGDLPALPFLGLDLANANLDMTSLRGNFNQSAFDRLQLIELIRQSPDVDGDGLDDLDIDNLGYMGVSLGAMVGPAVLALSEDIQLGALPVAGGHLIAFTLNGDLVETFMPVFYNLIGSEDAFRRLLPVAQALLDPADPASWAAHVTHDRLVGNRVPDVLLPVSLVDGVVPPAAGRALARGLGVPHMPPVAEAVIGLDLSGPAPLTTNLDGTTGAYFQLDRVTSGDDVVAGDHSNVPWSPEGTLMVHTFFETWLDTGRATIIDPYAALDTPPM